MLPLREAGKAALVVLALTGVVSGLAVKGNSGERRSLNQGHKSMRKPNVLYTERILSPLPRGPVPDQWLWNDVNGTNYLTVMRNQHIPQYCGSCWAFAATSALSDRLKISRKAKWPDIVLSPQVLLSCGNSAGDGCHGGEAFMAYDWMSRNEITDETCSIYQARGHDNGLNCTNISLCETCSSEYGCSRPQGFQRYRVHEFGNIKGDTREEREESMKAEIFHRGPIACEISVTDKLMNYTGGVFVDKTGATDIDHDISVVGYGVDQESGLKYWLIRNSWGTYWGEDGLLKLVRGVNNLAIESGNCAWATPLSVTDEPVNHDVKTNEIKVIPDLPDEFKEIPSVPGIPRAVATVWKLLRDLIVISTDASLNEEPVYKQRYNLAHKTCHVPGNYSKGELVLTRKPQDYVDDGDLPKNWDWRNVDGRNYLSWTINQHIPKYCGSCWAQASVSALADRFIVADRKRFANLALSAQVILNCRAGGSCEGGNAPGVYEFAHEKGIPDQTCMQYDAQDDPGPANGSKPSLYVCRNCEPPIPSSSETGLNHCWPVANFTRYYASEYGSVRGAKSMKKEIYKRGPLACSMKVTHGFLDYKGGIYSESTFLPFPNHLISVVGWGYDEQSGAEYWVGRNSWGTYWGEQGFFRMQMHKNNLLIEDDCYYAVPKVN